jgi:hypothetical protein
MALALRGGAFRQGQNKQMDRCGEGTYAAQKTVADSVHEHVVQAFEKLGFEVDVFIAGFPCDTNMHYMQDLAGWFNASAERTDFFHPETDIPEHLNRQGLHSNWQGRRRYCRFARIVLHSMSMLPVRRQQEPSIE